MSDRSDGTAITVAVIIPARNATATIGRAVRSALAQREAEQVIVVDDASTDDTASVAAAAAGGDPRLIMLVQSRNCGPAAARSPPMKYG